VKRLFFKFLAAVTLGLISLAGAAIINQWLPQY
jgi:hypothetical protein